MSIRWSKFLSVTDASLGAILVLIPLFCSAFFRRRARFHSEANKGRCAPDKGRSAPDKGPIQSASTAGDCCCSQPDRSGLPLRDYVIYLFIQ